MSQTLDAIERRLTTDPLLAGAVLDLAEVVRLTDLDGGRPASLVRLGLVIDALARRLGDDTVPLYPVLERGVLSDTDLTSNERMVVRRWSDDGLAEVIPAGASVLVRVREIATLSGLPPISRTGVPGVPDPGYVLLPAPGGAVLAPHQPTPSDTAGSAGAYPALGRWWRCPEPDCPSFGPRSGQRFGPGQPPPSLGPGGVPLCPRHGTRLGDAGPRPAAVPFVAWVGGEARHRFVVPAGQPVNVGRLPDGPDDVALGPFLDAGTGRWISRTHVGLALDEAGPTVTDLSTNGTVVLARSAPTQHATRVTLARGQSRVLGTWDSVELHDGVLLRRAGVVVGEPAVTGSGSVMAEAPTMALRLPEI